MPIGGADGFAFGSAAYALKCSGWPPSGENAAAAGNSRFSSADGSGERVDAVRGQRDRAGRAEREHERGRLLQVLQGHPFQGSDYTRRVKSVAGLLVGLGAAALVLGTDLVSGALARGSGLHALQTARAQDLRLAADADRAPRNRAQGHRARRNRRVLAAQPAAVRRPLAVAARRARDAARLPGARPGEAHRLRRQLRRGRHAHAASTIGGDTLSGAESDEALVEAVKAAGNVILLADATYNAASGESAGAAGRPGSPRRAGRRRAPRRSFRRLPRWRRPAARSATTSSSSIPTARCGTPCRSRRPAVARPAVARPRRGARGRRHRARAMSGSTATAW